MISPQTNQTVFFAPLLHPLVAIGNFDGAHRGHRHIVQEARALAAARNSPDMPICALTFEPHPRRYFQPNASFFRLTPPCDREACLKAIGFDHVITLPFDAALAAMSAEDFIATIILQQFHAAGVVVGEDFHFGKGRAGTPAFLVEAGKRHGFDVRLVPPFREDKGNIISSSAIRAALGSGEVERANALLGDTYSITGEVIHGRKLGRDLGYPTANIALDAGNGLKHGIYACRLRVFSSEEGTSERLQSIRPSSREENTSKEKDRAVHRSTGIETCSGVGSTTHPAIASFGVRPHFDNGAPLLEVHVFDFSGDLYGKTARVEFISYLRGEAKFDSLDALIAQMDADSARARVILNAPKA